MKRTQIYLSDEMHEQLRRVAFEQRKSIARVAREALETHLITPRAARERTAAYVPRANAAPARRTPKARTKKRTRGASEKNPLSAMVGMFDSGMGDWAERHDEYLLRRNQERK